MIRQIFGLGLIFFIPGFLLTNLFFEKSKKIEKIILTIIFSICFNVILALIIGFNRFTYDITGGINKIFLYSVIINLVLSGIYLLRKKEIVLKKK